jgi:rod shape-determining protein MreD
VKRAPNNLLWISVLLALFFSVLPLPGVLTIMKPFWLGLVVCYFALEAPERMSLSRAFLLGLIGDVFSGTLFGEQAARLVIMAFIVLRFRFRVRFFPIWQQAAAILVLHLNDRVVSLWIRLLSGEGMPGPSFWLAPLSAALLWPWMFVLLDSIRTKRRVREAA